MPHVEWTTPSGTILTLQSQPPDGIRVLANNSLSIDVVKEVDAGSYTCTAVNNNGRRSASASLTVLGKCSFVDVRILQPAILRKLSSHLCGGVIYEHSSSKFFGTNQLVLKYKVSYKKYSRARGQANNVLVMHSKCTCTAFQVGILIKLYITACILSTAV